MAKFKCIFITVIILVHLALFKNIYCQWFRVGQTPYLLGGLSAVNENVIWAFPLNISVVYLSTNGGANFSFSPVTMANGYLWAISGTSSTRCFVGDGGSNTLGGNAGVYLTTNAGVSWTRVLSTGGNYGFINGIVFSKSNPLVGIVQSDPPNGPGQPYWIAKTTNGGNTWSIQNPPGVSGDLSTWPSVFCVDALFYGFGLYNSPSRIMITSNGGAA